MRVDGQDAMPRLHKIAREKLAKAQGGEPPSRDDAPFSWRLFEFFGAFPAVLDRHVTEFFPELFDGGWYFGKRLGVDAFSIEDTIARGDSIFAEMREQAFSSKPLPLDYLSRKSGEHEQVLEIIDSIRQGAGRVYSANLPNRGQVSNLPAEAIVESPAIADATGVKPIQQAPLSAGLVGTLTRHMAWVETVVEAALEGSRAKFVQALVLDGAVRSLDMAERLADELLQAQRQYLPQFELGN
jgi:alpha-galactosidase